MIDNVKVNVIFDCSSKFHVIKLCFKRKLTLTSNYCISNDALKAKKEYSFLQDYSMLKLMLSS